MKPRLKAYFYLLSVAAMWGIAGPIIKFTLGGINALTFLLYRFAISTIVSLITIKFLSGQHPPKNKKTFIELIIWCLITTTLALGLLFLGLEKTTVVDTTIITMASPLMITFAGAYLLHEHITKREKIGTIIAISGIALTTIEPILQNQNNGTVSGNLLIATSLIAGTLSAVMTKRLVRKGVSPSYMVSLSFIIGFLSLLPFVFLYSPNILTTIYQLPIPYHLGVFYMALISGNLAYVLWVKGQKTIEISEASIFGYLGPVFAFPLAVLWLGEKIYPNLVLGAIIIIIGVFIAETKPSHKS